MADVPIVIQLRSLYYMFGNLARGVILHIPKTLLTPLRAFALIPNKPSFKVSREAYHSYFKKILPTIESECSELIEQMGKQQLNLKKIASLFDKYLNINVSDKSLIKTIHGVLGLLSAMEMSGVSSSLPKYKNLVMEQINRLKIQGEKVDKIGLNYFVATEETYRKLIKEKAKATRLLLNLIIITYHNFTDLDPKHYFFLLSIVNQNPAHYMQPVAKLLQKHTADLLRKIMANDKDKDKNVQLIRIENTVISAHFLCSLSLSYKNYGVEENQQEDFKLVFAYIKKRFFEKYFNRSADNTFSCNFLYRNFNETVKDEKGIPYKSLLLNEIVNAYLSTQKAIAAFAGTKQGYFLCSSILTYEFYLYAQSLPFQHQGSFRYISKAHLPKRPELPPIFWDIYNQNPRTINMVSYICNSIRDIYPEKFIPTNTTLQTIEPYTDTELKIRAEDALKMLGLKFQSEVNISGRFIDFLLDGNIIVQLDGVHHFKLQQLQMNEKTHARNVHLLLKGYRLILINIFEYNIARESDQLKDLIVAKLSLMKQKDAIIVI